MQKTLVWYWLTALQFSWPLAGSSYAELKNRKGSPENKRRVLLKKRRKQAFKGYKKKEPGRKKHKTYQKKKQET